jgi:hypothetical protein
MFDCQGIAGKAILVTAVAGVVWDHKGGRPPSLPPDSRSVQIQITAANTTTTTPAPPFFIANGNSSS